jgi:hypothetical protein
MSRRQAINDFLTTRLTFSQASLAIETIGGTRAVGGKRAGTITYGRAFSGTPTTILEVIRGTGVGFRSLPLSVISRYSGSFTWKGSPTTPGTFAYMAYGPA